MAETGGKSEPQEPSMEDILASIRRILAEDGSLTAGDAAAARGAVRPTGAPSEATPPEEDETEPTEPPADPRQPAADSAAAAALAANLFDTEPAYAPAPPSGAVPRRPEPAEEDVFMLSADMRAGGHKLVSPQAAVESTDVLSQLARAILDRRDIAVATRDVTLEDMVREMLRPLLREWLDRNLPYLIERLVKKEIDLMINRAERLED